MPTQQTRGPIHSVPCPHCQQSMDFRPLADESSGGSGWGTQGLERGATVHCDHCEGKSKISAIATVTVIHLAPE